MKSYHDLKAEKSTVQQQMAEAKKSELTNAIKEITGCAKSLALLLGCLKAFLLKEGGSR
jgi:hypothetical protein